MQVGVAKLFRRAGHRATLSAMVLLAGGMVSGLPRAAAQESEPAEESESPQAPSEESGEESADDLIEGGGIDWATLEAEEFLDETERLFHGPKPPEPELARRIVEHGWWRFLGDGHFLLHGDWETVSGLVRLLVDHRHARIMAADDEARAEQQAEIAEEMAGVRARLIERWTGEELLVTRGEYAGVRELSELLADLGASQQEQAAPVLRWVQGSDWRESASFGDLMHLLRHTLSEELGTVRAIRYTGYLEGPGNAPVTLEQARQMRDDLHARVWLDGRLVLDSHPRDDEDGRPVGEERFVTETHRMEAEHRQPLRIELEQRPRYVPLGYTWDERLDESIGMALLWGPGEMERELVPPEALSPPQGFAPPGVKGLKAEYYSDVAMLELLDTRLAETMDCMHATGPILPRYLAEYREVLTVATARMAEHEFLERISDEERAGLVQGDLAFIAGQMPANSRASFCGWLLAHADLLAELNAEEMASLYGALFPLSGGEHLSVLAKWSEMQPQPRAEVAVGLEAELWYGARGHIARLEPLGRQLGGGRRDDARELIDGYLSLSDGTCNLNLAYPMAMGLGSGYTDGGREFWDRLSEVACDRELPGDTQATWLLARAETAMAWRRGNHGIEDLQSALLIAESEEVRFWVLTEMVCRHIGYSQGERGIELLDRFGADFAAEEHQAKITQWRAELRFVDAYALVREQQNRVGAISLHIGVLEERRENDRERNDDSGVARYDQLIEAAERHRQEEQAKLDALLADAEALLAECEQ